MRFRELQRLVKRADYDSAIDQIGRENLSAKLASLPADSLDTLHARCLLCEVYDYADQNEAAVSVIEKAGEKAKVRLEKLLVETRESKKKDFSWMNNGDLRWSKQEAWACLHVGMVRYYRRDCLKEAQDYFEISEQIFTKLHGHLPSFGSIARANYCLGLVGRNDHKYDEGREFFSRSVELAWSGRSPNDPAEASLQYNIGKCLGLGMAWIAYTRASLSDANAHIVAARLLLANKGVRYIQAYLEIVHACTLMSAHGDSLESLHEAVKILQSSYEVLGGDAALRGEGGHTSYALRAAIEMASGHLRLARLHGKKGSASSKNKEMENARRLIELVKASPVTPSTEKRTLCNAFIIESRILRELGEPHRSGVLAAAQKAKKIGWRMGFTRIDCAINLGEAHLFCGNYDDAVECFQAARTDERAQTNPKVLAVCDLHLARCFLATGKVLRAQEQFNLWKATGKRGADNSFVREMSAAVENDFRSSHEPLFIDGDSELKPHEQMLDLKQWLARTALRRTDGDRTKAIEMLDNISLNTLKNWLQRKGK